MILVELSSLCSVDARDIEQLLDDAFGTERHQRTAYLLRKGCKLIDDLSFAIIDDKNLVGCIQCWPVALDFAPLILVGPVAVSPRRQNQGIGHQLMNATLGAVKPTDPPMIMIGDPDYYGRFGFVADSTSGWTLPGPWEPHRLLLRNPAKAFLSEIGFVGPRL